MDKQHNANSGALWLVLVAHLVCCGGAALLLTVGGAGVAGVGLVRASHWLLIAGFVVVAVGLIWRRRRSQP